MSRAEPGPRGQPGNEEDPQLEHMLGMQAVATHWGELPPREQKILLLRFYGGITQAQVGQQLGISQMHVSRLLAHALAMRPRLLGLPEQRIRRRCRWRHPA